MQDIGFQIGIQVGLSITKLTESLANMREALFETGATQEQMNVFDDHCNKLCGNVMRFSKPNFPCQASRN